MLWPLALLLAFGCPRGPAPPPACPEGVVSLEGEPLELPFGRAVLDGHWLTVHRFNVDVPCEDLLAPSRVVRDGELDARVSRSTQGGGGVGLGADAGLGAFVSLREDGDTVALCLLDPVTFTLQTGARRGKEVQMQGLFTGTHCGERKGR